MTLPLLMFALVIAFSATLLALELLTRKFHFSSEITRRAAHVLTGIFAAAAYLLLPIWAYASCVIIFLIVIAYSHSKKLLTSVHNVKRRTYGAVYFPVGLLGALVAAQLLSPSAYIPSIFVLTFADTLGGLTSDVFKTPRKSNRGSIVFVAVAWVILATLTPLAAWQCGIIALLTGIVERMSKNGSDNATVPVATVLLLAFFKA